MILSLSSRYRVWPGRTMSNLALGIQNDNHFSQIFVGKGILSMVHKPFANGRDLN